MGQKVNPYGFRLGVTTDWKSRWFSTREYKEYLTEDWKIRDYLMGALSDGAVSRIEVERTRDKLRIDVHTARPGIVIGRKGAKADELRAGLTRITGNQKVQLNIVEIKTAELDAEVEVAPLIKEADPEFERLLAEEEDIERRIHDAHETPHFRGSED